jgi:hypothetical protein
LRPGVGSLLCSETNFSGGSVFPVDGLLSGE